MLLVAFVFIGCTSAFNVAKVEPKEIHVRLGESFWFLCTADNWYEWCTLKHADRVCDIEWKRTPYNVTMGECSDYEGRVEFKVRYQIDSNLFLGGSFNTFSSAG